MLSTINHTTIAPTANAERFTSIPKNNPKEKKPTSLMKKASKNSNLEKIILNSLKSEYIKPKIKEVINTKSVDMAAKTRTV